MYSSRIFMEIMLRQKRSINMKVKESTKVRNLSILIKPASSNCNMQCRYCFYHDVAQHRQHANMGFMTDNTMQVLIDQAIKRIDIGGQLNFAFQGGEPTLCGREFFERFVAYVKEVSLNKRCKVTYALQTNGLLLDDAFCNFLARENFLLGLSLDGTRKLNDCNRIDQYGKGTYDRIVKTIRRLRKFKVEFNILSVITRRHLAQAEALYKFYEQQEFTHVQIIPCIDSFDADDSTKILPSRKYGEFLCEMFRLWVQGWEQGKPVSIREFDNFAGMVLYQQEPELCAMRGNCSINPVVEANGNIYPCDFYVLDHWDLGSIYDATISELLINDKAKEFICRSQQMPDDCKACQWIGLCRGGCRRMWEPWIGDNPSSPKWCAAQKIFIPFALEQMPRLIAAIQRMHRR